MNDSIFFLPCLCIIICTIIITISWFFNQSHNRVFNEHINDTNTLDFICLGDSYIDVYSIKSIYLNDTDRTVNIKLDAYQYDYRFTCESDYDNYLIYLEQVLGINTTIHNNW